MARDTIRDRIWATALNHSHRADEAVTPEQIASEVGASEQTVRDTLNTMDKHGWIRRDQRKDGTVRFIPVDWP